MPSQVPLERGTILYMYSYFSRYITGVQMVHLLLMAIAFAELLLIRHRNGPGGEACIPMQPLDPNILTGPPLNIPNSAATTTSAVTTALSTLPATTTVSISSTASTSAVRASFQCCTFAHFIFQLAYDILYLDALVRLSFIDFSMNFTFFKN